MSIEGCQKWARGTKRVKATGAVMLCTLYREEEDSTGAHLFENTYIEETKRTIHKFWLTREKKAEGTGEGVLPERLHSMQPTHQA